MAGDVKLMPSRTLRTVLVVAAVAAVLATSARAAEEAPISLLEFRRLSVEDPHASLDRGEQLIATAYAAAHPEWTREVLFRMARAAMLVSDDAGVELAAKRLDALAREKGDTVAGAYASFTRASAWANAGRVEDAVAAATDAANRLDATGDPTLQAVASIEMCDAVVRATRPDLDLHHCDDAVKRWAVLGDPFQLGRAENYASLIARADGRLDDAIRIGKQARADFLRAGTPSLAVMMDDNMAGMYLDKGDAATALTLSRGSLARELAAGKMEHAILSRMNIAHALSLLGHHRQALATIAQAIADAKRTGYDMALPDLYDVQVDAADAAGKPEIAVAAARASVEVIRRLTGQEAERAMAEMEARYRTLQKQRELESAQANLHRKRLQLALVAVAGVGLALVALLLVLLLSATRRREREFAVLSRTDALTGAASRRAFLEVVDRVFAAGRDAGTSAALWVIDADHFKRINDEHGHQAGDEILRELVACVRANIRAGDTLGRLGGEEFGIVLPGATAEEAVERAESVRTAIETAQVHAGEATVSVTVSIGVAMLDPRRHDTVERWIAAADEQVYEAKHSGRNRVALAA
jgi:diguanylate cyclase (GGDEF)-like protein